MKENNKLRRLISMGLLSLIFILSLGTQSVWGVDDDLTYQSEYTEVSAGTLKKGNAFSVRLSFKLKNDKSNFTEEEIQVAGVEGSADGDDMVCEYMKSTGEAGEATGVLVIRNLTYTGKGSSVTFYIKKGSTYDEDNKISVWLPNVQELVSPGLALEIGDNNTVNLVAGETQQIPLTLTNTSQDTSEEGYMILKIKEKNTSAKNIKLLNTKYDIPSLKPGESKKYSLTISINDDVTRGIHEMELNIDGTSHTVKLKVDSNFMPPSLSLTAQGIEGFEVNKPRTVTLKLKNVGNITAKNIKLELVPNEKVYVVEGSNVRYVENIETGKSQTAEVRLQVSDSTATTVPLQIKLTYTDDLGQKQEDNQYIYLTTEGALVNKEISIENIVEPTGEKKPNESFELKFTLSAESNTKNVKVSVNGTEGIIAKSKNLFIIPEIKAGQKNQYSVTLAATSATKSGAYPIEIKTVYKLNNEEITMSQYGSVVISNPEADEETKEGETKVKKGMPKVIVDYYKANPVVVSAGEEFDLEIGFLNTSSTKGVHNFKANLTIKEEGEKEKSGNVFTPVGASNTFYIADLAPGQTNKQKIRLYTVPSAAPKTYEITIEMEYEDDKGNEVKATELIGIPVEQTTKMEIAEVQMDVLQVGMPCSLTATLYNTGHTDINNVMIHIEGEGFDVEENKYFIGVFEQGASDYYNPTIIPNQAGNLQAKIVIEYEDSTGKLQTITHDIELDVTEMEPMIDEEMDLEMTKPEQSSKWPQILGVSIGIGIAAAIAFIVIRKRNKRLEAFELDEN